VAALGVFSLRDPRLHSLGVRLPIRIVGALLALWEPYPDWRGYERLALDVGNPTEAPLLLQVHIRDQSQSRDRQSGYVGGIEVRPRSRQVHRIALQHLTDADGRARVNTGSVDSIVLRRDAENRAPEFYLAGVWLE